MKRYSTAYTSKCTSHFDSVCAGVNSRYKKFRLSSHARVGVRVCVCDSMSGLYGQRCFLREPGMASHVQSTVTGMNLGHTARADGLLEAGHEDVQQGEYDASKQKSVNVRDVMRARLDIHPPTVVRQRASNSYAGKIETRKLTELPHFQRRHEHRARSKENLFAPPLVSTIDKRIIHDPTEALKYDPRLHPLIGNSWSSSLRLLHKGSKNGLFLSTLRDYRSGKNEYFDKFTCRKFYATELIRCESAMKPVYRMLYRLRIRSLYGSFQKMLRHLLQRREYMSLHGEDRLANRKAHTHFVFAMCAKYFKLWRTEAVRIIEIRLRLRYSLGKVLEKVKNQIRISFRRWKYAAKKTVLTVEKKATLLKSLSGTSLHGSFLHWSLFVRRRRMLRRLGVRIDVGVKLWCRLFFLRWVDNDKFTKVVNAAHRRLVDRCFNKLRQHVLNEFRIYTQIRRARRKIIHVRKLHCFDRWVDFKILSQEAFKKYGRVHGLVEKCAMATRFLRWKHAMFAARELQYAQLNPLYTVGRGNWLDKRIHQAKKTATKYFIATKELEREYTVKKMGHF